MSHFYAEIQGSRGPATRGGDKRSGIYCHIRGWNKGIKVCARHDDKKDRDIFEVYVSGGSNARTETKLIGRFAE
jgi:thioredoxin reductase